MPCHSLRTLVKCHATHCKESATRGTIGGGVVFMSPIHVWWVLTLHSAADGIIANNTKLTSLKQGESTGITILVLVLAIIFTECIGIVIEYWQYFYLKSIANNPAYPPAQLSMVIPPWVSTRIIISSLIKQLTERNRDNQQTTNKCL